MRINDGLLLHGKPITVPGVGKIHSPLLDDIFKDEQSFYEYAFARAIIGGTKDDLKKLIDSFGIRSEYEDMSDLAFDEASKFCLIWHSQILRKFLADGLKLFCEDKVGISENPGCFIFVSEDDKITGVVDDSNYKEFEETLLSTLSPGKETKSDLKFANKAAEDLWEQQNKLEAENPAGDPEDFTLTNIIS